MSFPVFTVVPIASVGQFRYSFLTLDDNATELGSSTAHRIKFVCVLIGPRAGQKDVDSGSSDVRRGVVWYGQYPLRWEHFEYGVQVYAAAY